MPKILQLNVTANWGSTGKIAEGIGIAAMERGWESTIAYGRYKNPSQSLLLNVGSKLDIYLHYALNRIFDGEGLGSLRATKALIRKIESISPDIIHLHNIHDHWLNYPILLEYLAKITTPIVWTFHDCWAYTGGCSYYSFNNCDKWKTECRNCQFKHILPSLDQTERQFKLRQFLINSIKNLTIVTVSNWLCNEVYQSFIKRPIYTIYNGIDIEVFKPKNHFIDKYDINGRKVLLGVASSWSERKGLEDYIKLSNDLPSEYVLCLVGLSNKQLKKIPNSIIGIERTQNSEELAQLYSMAEIVLNLSREETFGLTTVEGAACGTPGIVYNTTASPELITPETGFIVNEGDLEGVLKAINDIAQKGKIYYTNNCRNRVLQEFNSKIQFSKYIDLYEEILSNK